jgi:hypothetical protein
MPDVRGHRAPRLERSLLAADVFHDFLVGRNLDIRSVVVFAKPAQNQTLALQSDFIHFHE